MENMKWELECGEPVWGTRDRFPLLRGYAEEITYGKSLELEANNFQEGKSRSCQRLEYGKEIQTRH